MASSLINFIAAVLNNHAWFLALFTAVRSYRTIMYRCESGRLFKDRMSYGSVLCVYHSVMEERGLVG